MTRVTEGPLTTEKVNIDVADLIFAIGQSNYSLQFETLTDALEDEDKIVLHSLLAKDNSGFKPKWEDLTFYDIYASLKKLTKRGRNAVIDLVLQFSNNSEDIYKALEKIHKIIKQQQGINIV